MLVSLGAERDGYLAPRALPGCVHVVQETLGRDSGDPRHRKIRAAGGQFVSENWDLRILSFFWLQVSLVAARDCLRAWQSNRERQIDPRYGTGP